MKTLVVLPSYNESENIAKLSQALLALSPDINVCVVDDNSPDGTAGIMQKFIASLGAEQDRVHLIVRAKKDGRGGAVRTGLEWGLKNPAFGAFVEMDCDFSHPPEKIPQGLELLKQHDVALGSRYPDGEIVGWPAHRRIFSFFANTLARFLISWKIADYTNGYRFYTRRAAEFMGQHPQQHKGYIYLSETLAAFLGHGFKIASFPIRFVNRERGVSNTSLKEIRSALTGIFAIAWDYRFHSK